MKSFYAAKQSITTGYLARAVVNNVLKGGELATSCLDSIDGTHEDDLQHCCIS
jgi:hypothetical protein